MTKITQEELNSCFSIADVCRKVGWVPSGDNYRRAKELIKDMDSSHFRKGPWNKGKKVQGFKNRPLEEILVENSTYRATNHLRERLIKEGYKLNQCEYEGCAYCQNLELHHINGNPSDNRLENLQLLCPNHHAMTENFRGKNSSIVSHGKIHQAADKLFLDDKEVAERYEKKLEEKREKQRKKYKEEHPDAKDGISKSTKREMIICPICGKEFPRTSKRKVYCSDECRVEGQMKEGKRPSFPELVASLKECKSFIATGKKYDVSDNTIRKWCKIYSIPIHTDEMQKFVNKL